VDDRRLRFLKWKEAAMHRFPHLLLWLPVAILAFVSCAPNPRIVSGTESDYLLQLRAEYLAANPDGQYNEYVSRGEVVKGMDFLAVLASWGHPDRRVKESPQSEQWEYRDVDETSKDWLVYSFKFRGSVLEEWDLIRHFAAGGLIDVPEGRDQETLTRGDYTGNTGSGAPRK
jgi:hypothetical protein